MAYGVLVVSALLFEFAMNLPIGSMPFALTTDGSSLAAVAIAMGSGMFTGLFSSIPLGSAVDRFGKLVIIRIAALAGVLSLLGLAYCHGALAGGIVMGCRSIAIVGFMAAEFAYASNLASKDRAVSGVATLGMIGNLTFAIAPAMSVFLWQHGFGREQYVAAAGVAALGGACLFLLPARFDSRTRGTHRLPLIHPRWYPAIAYAIVATMQSGVNVSLAVLTFTQRGVVNGAAIFSATALSAFALRYPAGRFVDRFGPRSIAIPVALVQAAGCIVAAVAHSLFAVVVAGTLLGCAWAAVVPLVLGLLFEHGSKQTRGAAMGAYNLAFSSGAAVGAVLATLCTFAGIGYTGAIALCALAPVAVLPYVLRSQRARRVAMRAPAVTTSS